MYKDNVTVLHVEYPVFRDDDRDHVFTTALGIMFNDFNQTDKFHYLSPAEHHNMIQLFMRIHEKLAEEQELYEKFGSISMIHMIRSNDIYPLLEKLFYETEYQVNLSIAPLKLLSSLEEMSLGALNHLQRFNKTTQQRREEKIDLLIDNEL